MKPQKGEMKNLNNYNMKHQQTEEQSLTFVEKTSVFGLLSSNFFKT